MASVPSTYRLLQNSTAIIGEKYKTLAKASTQMSTGLQDKKYSEIELGRLQKITALQSSIIRENRQLAVMSRLATYLQDINVIFKCLSDCFGGASTSILSYISYLGKATDSNLQLEIQSKLSTIKYLLNSSLEDNYIFAGSKTNTSPVWDIVSISNIVHGEITSNYYDGDNCRPFIVIGDNTYEYGMTANAPCIQKMIAALHISLKATSSDYVDSGSLAKAYQLAREGHNGILIHHGELADCQRVLRTAIATSTEHLALLEESLLNFNGLPTAEYIKTAASIEVTSNQIEAATHLQKLMMQMMRTGLS